MIRVYIIMDVEVKRIELKYLHSFGRYLYVVRIKTRKCYEMDYYKDVVRDFGAYPSKDMADSVADAIRSGEIIVNECEL